MTYDNSVINFHLNHDCVNDNSVNHFPLAYDYVNENNNDVSIIVIMIFTVVIIVVR